MVNRWVPPEGRVSKVMTQTNLDQRVRALARGKVPGIVLIVVGAEGVRARSVVGMADLVARRPISSDAAVPWFSMTKIATATTAIRLAERGVIDLDAPVHSLVASRVQSCH